MCRTKIASRLVVCALLAAGTGMASRTLAAEDAKQTVVVRLAQLDDEINTLRSRLTTTMAALEELKGVAAKNGELATPYKNFSEALDALQGQATLLRERGTAAKARAQEHWTAWQAELVSMQNPALREKAQARYAAAVKEFQKIVERVDVAKETFAPLMADLKDIDTYLKTDLSKDAVSSLSGTIWKMANAAKKTDSRLADVNEQIRYTIKKMPQR